MSLPRWRQQRSFFDTEQVLGRLVAKARKGAERFVFFAEKVWPELVKLRPQLQALERIEALARPEAWGVWWERYVENKLDYQAGAAQLRAKMEQAGEDAREVLRWTKDRKETQEAAESLKVLERVYTENFEETAGAKVEQRRAQPPGAVRNPHEPEATWSTKKTTKQKEWVGYKVQVAETVEEQPRGTKEPTCAVITAVVTQEAIASDKAALPVVEAAWEATGQPKPEELYVDAGYTSGAEVVRAEGEGRELKGPMAPPPSKEGRLSSEAFEVSVAERRAKCPAGQNSTNCSRLEEEKTGAVHYRFEWNKALCGVCPQRAQCLGQGQSHRTLVVGEHHDQIQARRQEQKTETFQADMTHRNAIEGTISELARAYGLRHCRYRGLAKSRLQNWFIGAACNLNRWCRRRAWELQQASGRPITGSLIAVAA